MALEVEGVPILSLGEFRELNRGMDQDAPAHPVILAWLGGEEVEPSRLWLVLDVAERLAAREERSVELIDLALCRLKEAFPDEAG